MNKSKRLNYSETLRRIQKNLQFVTDGPLSTVQINLLIKHNGWLLQELLNNALEEFGLNSSGYIAMIMINSAEGYTANPSDMSLCTGETRANMTRICDDLEMQGLLHRITCQEDRRRVDMSLTPKGLELLMHVIPKVRACDPAVIESDEREILERSLLKLLHSLEAHI